MKKWLDKYAEGGEPSDSTSDLEYYDTSGPYSLTKDGAPQINLKGLTINPLTKLQYEFKKANPFEDFIYLTALEKGLGYSVNNPPKISINAYDKKMNNYVSKKLLEQNPQGKKGRLEWLDSFAPIELNAIKSSNSKKELEPDFWAKLENHTMGYSTSGVTFKNPSTTVEEAKADQANPLNLLNPIIMASNAIQAPFKKGYSVGDAAQGKQTNAGTLKQIITDPTTYVGAGILSGANKAIATEAKLAGKFLTEETALKNAYKLNPKEYQKKDWLQGYKQIEVPKSNFQSEIDWEKRLKDNNPNYDAEDIKSININAKEYNKIEQTAKENGSWMKNMDGSEFTGTPEQFVQQQSSNFKRAYPEGFEETYRGGDVNPELNSKYLKGSNVVFTTKDDYGAQVYNRIRNPYNSLSTKELPPRGISKLYIPKTFNKLTIDGTLDEYSRRNYARLDVINQNPKNLREAEILGDFKKWMREEYFKVNLSDEVMTDHFASFLNTPKGKTVDRVEFKKILDGTINPIDVEAHNLHNKKMLKSMFGNNGDFDMTKSGIYKTLLPGATGIGAYYLDSKLKGTSPKEFSKGGKISKSSNWLNKYAEGGPVIVPGTTFLPRNGSRPYVRNLDGSLTNEKTITAGSDAHTFILPTAWEDTVEFPTVGLKNRTETGVRVHSNEEAWKRFRETGEHMGAFESVEDAERGATYREWMNNELSSFAKGGKISKSPNWLDKIK